MPETGGSRFKGEMGMQKTTAARRRSAAEHRGLKNTYVVEGNTVKSVVVREDVLRRAHAEQERRRRQQEQNEERAQKRAYAQRNARPMDLFYLLMMSLAVIAMAVIIFNYLSLKSSIDQRMVSVKSLEVQLENLRTENDALEQSIDTSVDLNHVYDVAVNELGMVHAGKDNVIQYTKTESEYVRQNEDIPKN